MTRKKILIAVGVGVLALAVLTPSFLRARAKSKASATYTCAVHIDAAIDRWAVDNGVDVDVSIPLKEIAEYISPKAKCGCKAALAAGEPPRDPYGNQYVFGLTGPEQVQINPRTIEYYCSQFACWVDSGFD